MTQEIISQDLKTVLRRLKLGRMLDTLPERFTLARKQQMTHQDFLLLVLSDEASRRDGQAATIRAQRARLDPVMCLERWDESAKVHYDKTLGGHRSELIRDTFPDLVGTDPVLLRPAGVRSDAG
jgi:hypothetical protein